MPPTERSEEFESYLATLQVFLFTQAANDCGDALALPDRWTAAVAAAWLLGATLATRQWVLRPASAAVRDGSVARARHMLARARLWALLWTASAAGLAALVANAGAAARPDAWAVTALAIKVLCNAAMVAWGCTLAQRYAVETEILLGPVY
jgi:hypothetical protein